MSSSSRVDFVDVAIIARTFANAHDLNEDAVYAKAEAWHDAGKDYDKEDGAALLAYLSKVFHESL